jgi:hypothetical protein
MLLRVVMVGAVASLGLSLPTGRDLERWAQSGRAWWETTVAEWRARLPNVGPAVASEMTTEETEEPAPAAPKAPAAPVAARATAAPDFDAIVNQIAQSFGSPAAPAAKVEAKTPVRVEDDLELYAELADSVDFLPLEEAATDPAPMAVEQYLELAYGVVREAEPTPAPAKAATPAFEPVEVPEDLYPGLAYALNREAEGAPMPAPEPQTIAPAFVETEAEERGHRLADAVRLTGQAVQAWMSLLMQGPTVASAHR